MSTRAEVEQQIRLLVEWLHSPAVGRHLWGDERCTLTQIIDHFDGRWGDDTFAQLHKYRAVDVVRPSWSTKPNPSEVAGLALLRQRRGAPQSPRQRPTGEQLLRHARYVRRLADGVVARGARPSPDIVGLLELMDESITVLSTLRRLGGDIA